MPARRKEEDDKKRELETAENEKKREIETRERERRRGMEQKRKQQEKMEKENKRKDEENILEESCRQQLFRCNDRKTGVLSDMFVHVDITWEDFVAQLARHFQRPVYILYGRDGDGAVGDNQMQMIPGNHYSLRTLLCAGRLCLFPSSYFHVSFIFS
jgi:hypothetical protein